jgi:hypothetical protein
MFNYLFPIFCFGLVISGIVFIGIQQAFNQAKELAALKSESETGSEDSEFVSTRRNSAPIKTPASVSHQ